MVRAKTADGALAQHCWSVQGIQVANAAEGLMCGQQMQDASHTCGDKAGRSS
jgi:hypothetical protein